MSEPILSARGAEMRFGGVTALGGVSVEFATGELRCIIGPNGAGKSTLFNVLGGSLRPTRGQILFQGRQMAGRPVHEFARLGIARKFQVPSVFESMSVRENLEVGEVHLGEAHHHASRVEEMLELIGLGPLSHVKAAELAHGQKQWLEIGMALMSEPKVLLLDEPTAGMTVDETRKTADLLRALKGSCTILDVEHDMRFVRALSCHTMVMHQGLVLREGPFSDIEEDAVVRDIYLGRQ